MKTRLAAVRHRRQRCPAPRGLWCCQRDRSRRGSRSAGAAPPSPARSPARAPAPSRPPPRRGSRASRRPTRTPRSTTTPAARAPGAPSSSRAVSTAPAATRHSRATRPPRPDPLRRRRRRGAGLRLADRGRLQPPGRQRPAARAVDDRADLRRQDHQLERPGHRRRQPGRQPARPPPSPPCTARDKSGTTQNFTDYLSARPRPTGPTTSATPGRSRAARPPRAPPASSAR